MKTEKIYFENMYLDKLESEIVSIENGENSLLVELDKTIFFAEGGGQSCDLGYISDHRVQYVYEDGERIIHQVEMEGSELKEGDTILGAIDWSRRFDNMQRHCGEHILAGVMDREYGYTNRGFHMGDNYMTADFNFEKEGFRELSAFNQDTIDEIELYANKVIWEDLPVTIEQFDSLEEASLTKTRKPIEFEKDITVVTIGSFDNPRDCIACCGTHPDSTGQVGLLKIIKVEPYKGMWRFYFEAGAKAFKLLQVKANLLDQIEKDFSANDDNLLEALGKEKDKRSQAEYQLYSLQTSLSEMLAEKTLKLEVQDKYFVDGDMLDSKHASKLAQDLSEKLQGKALLVKNKDTLLVYSLNDKFKAGTTVKEFIAQNGGKGGGNDKSARIMLEDDAMEQFISQI